MKLRHITAAGSLLAIGGSLAIASPAHADFVTSCVGEGGAVTVPGDLFVPAGESCVLTGTTVEGDVTVRPGADLVVEDGTFNGAVKVREDGYFDAIDTSVTGAVVARSAFGTYLEGSALGGNVRAVEIDGSDIISFLVADESQLSGNLNAQIGDLLVDSATVDGNAVGNGTDYAEFHDTVVGGNLRVGSNPYGAVFCAGEVYGNTRVVNNTGPVQVGADGPETPCEGASYVDGNVVVTGNTAPVYLDNTIVRGNLTARNNDPVAMGGGTLRVRGTITGELGDIPDVQTLARQSQEDRKSGVEDRAEERRGEAADAAEDAGKAF